MTKYLRNFYRLLLLLAVIGLFSCKNLAGLRNGTYRNELKIAVPTEANSWIVNNLESTSRVVRRGGIKNWKSADYRIRSYFKVSKPGKLHVGIKAKVSEGKAVISAGLGEVSKKIKIENRDWDTIWVGNFDIKELGYLSIEIQGLDKTGEYFPEIESILLGGEATAEPFFFVKDDFYWGRRGPSVHLNFNVPNDAGNVEWFYNEITVPEGNDVLGSYFMANGFGQGYFGIQVNSPSERRVLFSVWSPFQTDNPKEIPENQRIKLLKKGEGVNTGEFGNEGSGGQSFYRFNWKAGTTYRFLLRGKPTGNGETDFTAWFYAPETGKWKLIASFRRPQTNTYLNRLYSFLENFMTETGYIQRMGLFSNQWICNAEGKWIELNKVTFTADATARKKSRLDYAGGTDRDAFFLKNCGFFNETTPINSFFERKNHGTTPSIDFEKLE